MFLQKAIASLSLIALISPALYAQQGVVVSAIRGTASKPDTVYLPKGKKAVKGFKLANNEKGFWEVNPLILTGKQKGAVAVLFKPSKAVIGIERASLVAYDAAGATVQEIPLTGLSTKALEGENEPPLASVMDALGYKVNLGWQTLAHHCKPALQGDELPVSLFRKAGRGKIAMIPIARYSPDFKLPFGYYLPGKDGPAKHEVGELALAGAYPEHQVLYPALSAGGTMFDPGSEAFGFYVTGPDHSAYSEDIWNITLHPKNVGHAARIYAAKDNNGTVIPNAYFVCFEEAKNGDYNDYVFLVRNISPVNTPAITSLFNGKDLNGWDVYVDGKGNTDPDQNFRIADNALHVNGRQTGYVITKKEYTDYHFKLDFKWGEKRYPPRENAKRDAGVCYHIAADEPYHIWPKSVECQIQEGDVGDFWLIGKTTIEVDGKPNQPKDYAHTPKKKDAEKPSGEWNTLEIISYQGKCIHIVNGEVVNYGTKASIQSGRIALQSEFAEVYYKNIGIREFK